MLWPLIITLLILLANTVFFFLGGQELLMEQSYWIREILSGMYKIVAYLLPVIICIFFREKRDLKQFFFTSLWWFTQKWVYLLCVIWFFLLFFMKKIWGDTHIVVHSFLYVLVVNSFVEEVVFRGYIQQTLVNIYWSMKWVIWQALLFGLVHIPFYYTKYQAWLYEQIETIVFSALPFYFDWMWLLVVLFAIASPILLWLIRWWVTEKTGSLRPAILLHSIHNGVLLFL